MILLVAIIGSGVWLRSFLHRSLPVLDGDLTLPGLAAPVMVERDSLGIPTITGETRIDVARATGFVHAQERFFQMDLARRRAAGELSELVGSAALPADKAARLHRMRAHARRAVAGASAESRAALEAYVEGVNAGLKALRAKPFEYLPLRTEPEPWRAEDCVLVLASMFFVLQDSEGARDTRVGLVYERLPGALADFVTSAGSGWEAPLLGDPLPPPSIPGSAIFNLRGGGKTAAQPRRADRHMEPFDQGRIDESGDFLGGSNNWAVAGSHTATGSAILANDMHLGISVPNTWYRTSLVWGPSGTGRFRVTGVTLPGMPSVVVGSNGHLAWGFTNAQADCADIVLVEPDPSDSARYITPAGPIPFEKRRETIRVKGGKDEILEFLETIWGPVAGGDPRSGTRLHAIHWVPQEPDGMNVRIQGIETSSSIGEAFDIANIVGIPAQNLVVATQDGHIGWTIAGRLPRRVGFDGRVPTSWADGSRTWDGWLSPREYPRLIDPPSGRIFTANNRTVGGELLCLLGDGGYDTGARARQIRDDLLAIERATPRDMLNVQLDDRALFLARWRDLAARALSGPGLAGNEGRRLFLDLILGSWTSRASTGSVGYRLVRSFRAKVAEYASAPLVAGASETGARPAATLGEGPLWQLVSARPLHLLDPKYRDWDDLLLAAIDDVVRELTAKGKRLADRSWGERNTVLIQHPLSRSLPLFSRWLDMPSEPLPGDNNMPRVQGISFGASERLAVSPGREDEGYFHMPGGQSGHPLSPHYGNGHRAWAHPEPTPFLPGSPAHRLRLNP